MTRRIVRSPNPFRNGATFHRDPTAGEMESVEVALPSTASHRQQVDELMREHPEGLTMHEVADLIGWNSRDNVNPRMQELKREGLVHKAGKTRDTGLGGRADVWLHAKFVVGEIPTTTKGKMPVKHGADARPARASRTRGASSTGTGITSEMRQRARERNRARRAAEDASTA